MVECISKQNLGVVKVKVKQATPTESFKWEKTPAWRRATSLLSSPP